MMKLILSKIGPFQVFLNLLILGEWRLMKGFIFSILYI